MKSIIVGAGTYGEVYLALLREVGVEIVGFLDDAPQLKGQSVRGISVLGSLEDLPDMKEKYGVEAVYCPLGNNKLRVSILKHALALGYEIPNFIHKDVSISPNVLIGRGIYVLEGTHIMPYTKIENFVMISMGVNIAHHSLLGEGTFLSTGVNFGASIITHKYTYIGMGTTIMTGVHELGENCLIGAGAVVIKDVPKNAVVAGVPGKILKYRE